MYGLKSFGPQKKYDFLNWLSHTSASCKPQLVPFQTEMVQSVLGVCLQSWQSLKSVESTFFIFRESTHAHNVHAIKKNGRIDALLSTLVTFHLFDESAHKVIKKYHYIPCLSRIFGGKNASNRVVKKKKITESHPKLSAIFS